MDVRPAAIGNCIRRRLTKAACLHLKRDMAEYLSPFQYRVSTPGGTEVITHLIQLCLQDNYLSLYNLTQNAFNSIHRDIILEVVDAHFFATSSICV